MTDEELIARNRALEAMRNGTAPTTAAPEAAAPSVPSPINYGDTANGKSRLQNLLDLLKGSK